MKWFTQSPASSIVGIVIAVTLIVIALKLLRSIAKPVITIIIIVAAILIFFNVLDLALLASTGKKLLGLIFEKTLDAGKEALADKLTSFIYFPFLIF